METLKYTSKSKNEISDSYLSSKEKIKSLRSLMSKNKIGAYLIPRADCFQGEFISENDNRLKWLTNFSGSAGLCIVTMKSIALFVDGRYRLLWFFELQVEYAFFRRCSCRLNISLSGADAAV